MKTTAVRMYGKDDLRFEEFELPDIKEDEILAHIISDSICMSSYKAAKQGSEHKRVPENIADEPVMIGHEFCGQIVKVGSKWSGKYNEGEKFTIQPALNYKGTLDAPGYSYRWVGGAATDIVIPNEVMEMDCLLPYDQEAYYYGSLSEPMSCIVGAFRASYHVPQGTYEHQMGLRPNGTMAILAGAGPMGLGAVDLALHGDVKPRKLVVTDIDAIRLTRAEELFPIAEAKKEGVELVYINTAKLDDPIASLKAESGTEGFDDVFVMAPVAPVVEQADRILAKDGCMNFFAGPTNTEFSAMVNFYDIHYEFHHIVGTSGGNTEDMKISLEMMKERRIDPSMMITHVGGLNSVPETTLTLPKIPGGKKLIYTNVNLPLTAIEDFAEKGKSDPFWAKLADITKRNHCIWNAEAEAYLLANAPGI
ncbi:MAG: zinc-binding dehydrogenase [Spirochaetaceae bacterium]|nr:zinc-binding dehydrogenase [Spirochaetaceae bacterium]